MVAALTRYRERVKEFAGHAVVWLVINAVVFAVLLGPELGSLAGVILVGLLFVAAFAIAVVPYIPAASAALARSATRGKRDNSGSGDQQNDRVNLELHRELAKKLRADPQSVLGVVPYNLSVLEGRLRAPSERARVAQWRKLVEGPVEELISAMVDDNSFARDLRKSSPFARALTREERFRAIERANKPDSPED